MGNNVLFECDLSLIMQFFSISLENWEPLLVTTVFGSPKLYFYRELWRNIFVVNIFVHFIYASKLVCHLLLSISWLSYYWPRGVLNFWRRFSSLCTSFTMLDKNFNIRIYISLVHVTTRYKCYNFQTKMFLM